MPNLPAFRPFPCQIWPLPGDHKPISLPNLRGLFALSTSQTPTCQIWPLLGRFPCQICAVLGCVPCQIWTLLVQNRPFSVPNLTSSRRLQAIIHAKSARCVCPVYVSDALAPHWFVVTSSCLAPRSHKLRPKEKTFFFYLLSQCYRAFRHVETLYQT